jgi:hypothetical protein
MARVNRMSVQKRLRERKKAEKAELKREMRERRDEAPPESAPTSDVASRDDLESYGLVDPPGDEPASS